jgi:formamidopyrimidine-DNA glycosylase
VLTPAGVDRLLVRLGPDPLRPGADGAAAHRRIARSRTAIGALLMDQTVLAGVGNVYRAELLFRHRISPFRPGREVDAPLWAAMWLDLVRLRRGAVLRADAHYVYRRTGLPCRVCGTAVRTQEMAGRNLYWCPACQFE